MPIINVTPGWAAGLQAAGEAAQGAEEYNAAVQARKDRHRASIAALRSQRMADARANAQTGAGLQDYADRRDALLEQRQWQREDRARAADERAAAQEANQAQLYDAAAQDIAPQDFVGPPMSAAYGATLSQAERSVPPALRDRMRETSSIVRRMSPEDGRQFVQDEKASMAQDAKAYDAQLVVRDIEDAGAAGLFGEDERGAQQYDNLLEIARRDPTAARRLLFEAQRSGSRGASQQMVRQDVMGRADEMLTMAKQLGVSPRASFQAMQLLGDFQAVPSMDPESFLKSFRQTLFASDERPHPYVVGLDKEVPDYSGWSNGGYIDDMTPRQEAEMRQVAAAIARKQVEIEGPPDPMAALDPNAPKPMPFEQRVQGILSDLMAMHGWVPMPDSEWYRRAGGDALLGGDTFGRVQEALGKQQADAQRSFEGFTQLPAMDSLDDTRRERVLRTVQEIANQPNMSTLDRLQAIAALGVNPLTVNDKDVSEFEPTPAASAASTAVSRARKQVEDLSSYPLTDPAELERARGELSAAQQNESTQRKAVQEAPATFSEVKAAGYKGRIPTIDAGASEGQAAQVEVMKRWAKREGNEPLARKLAKLQRQIGLRTQWKDDELRKAYAEADSAERAQEQNSAVNSQHMYH